MPSSNKATEHNSKRAHDRITLITSLETWKKIKKTVKKAAISTIINTYIRNLLTNNNNNNNNFSTLEDNIKTEIWNHLQPELITNELNANDFKELVKIKINTLFLHDSTNLKAFLDEDDHLTQWLTNPEIKVEITIKFNNFENHISSFTLNETTLILLKKVAAQSASDKVNINKIQSLLTQINIDNYYNCFIQDLSQEIWHDKSLPETNAYHKFINSIKHDLKSFNNINFDNELLISSNYDFNSQHNFIQWLKNIDNNANNKKTLTICYGFKTISSDHNITWNQQTLVQANKVLLQFEEDKEILAFLSIALQKINWEDINNTYAQMAINEIWGEKPYINTEAGKNNAQKIKKNLFAEFKIEFPNIEISEEKFTTKIKLSSAPIANKELLLDTVENNSTIDFKWRIENYGQCHKFQIISLGLQLQKTGSKIRKNTKDLMEKEKLAQANKVLLQFEEDKEILAFLSIALQKINWEDINNIATQNALSAVWDEETPFLETEVGKNNAEEIKKDLFAEFKIKFPNIKISEQEFTAKIKLTCIPLTNKKMLWSMLENKKTIDFKWQIARYGQCKQSQIREEITLPNTGSKILPNVQELIDIKNITIHHPNNITPTTAISVTPNNKTAKFTIKNLWLFITGKNNITEGLDIEPAQEAQAEEWVHITLNEVEPIGNDARASKREAKTKTNNSASHPVLVPTNNQL